MPDIPDAALRIPRCVAGEFARRGYRDHEELESVANLALAQALAVFDPAKGHNGADGLIPHLVSHCRMGIMTFFTRKNSVKRGGRARKLRLCHEVGEDLTLGEILADARSHDPIRDVDFEDLFGFLLDRLHPADREYFALYYRAGLDGREIGQRLGVTPQAVSQHLKRALEMARNLLEVSDG